MSQITTGEIHGVAAIVVEFEPVVVLATDGVGEGVGVAGHPFIDGDRERLAAVIGGARGGVKELLADKTLAVREGTVGMVGAEIGVIEIIKHAGLAVGVTLAQDQRARPGRQSKAGVWFTEAG